MSSLGARIKLLRGKNTQAWLARQLSIPPTTLSNYENDKSELNFAMIEALTSIFKVSTDWLLFGRGPMYAQGDVMLENTDGSASPVHDQPTSGRLNRILEDRLRELNAEVRELNAERRELNAENRALLKENAELRERMARLEVQLNKTYSAKVSSQDCSVA